MSLLLLLNLNLSSVPVGLIEGAGSVTGGGG